MPSHHSIAAGWKIDAQWSTQSRKSLCVVVALMSAPDGVGGVCGELALGGRCEAGGAHVDLGPEAQPGGQALVVEVEDHTLALAQHAEDRAGQRVGGQVELGQIGVAHDHTVTVYPGRRT